MLMQLESTCMYNIYIYIHVMYTVYTHMCEREKAAVAYPRPNLRMTDLSQFLGPAKSVYNNRLEF